MGINTVKAYGNTGPVIWSQYPDISLMTIDEDTPVKVIKEDLHFDFSENLAIDYSLLGRVSAQYTMENTNEENMVSRMVFPFIRNLWDRDEDQIEVLIDGEQMAYKIYYGKKVEETSSIDQVYEKVELQDILKSVSDKPYAPKNFDYDEKGILYRIRMNVEQDKDLNVEGYFTLQSSDSRILCKGNNSYGYDNVTNEFSFGTWVNKEEGTMEIFSFDEEIEIDMKGFNYVNSDKKEINDFEYDIEEIEMDFGTYYMDFLSNEEVPYSSFYLPEDKKLYDEALDQVLENERFITIDHINGYLSSPRYVLIAYEVPFDGFEKKTVEVRYQTLGSMDRSKTVEPTYTYEYFLHPAKYWKEFHNLTITITPSSTYPYVLDSNLQLDRESDGVYRGNFETLPEEDFSFILYEKEAITTIDKIESVVDRSRYIFYFVGIPVLGLFVFGILGVLSCKMMKSKKK